MPHDDAAVLVVSSFAVSCCDDGTRTSTSSVAPGYVFSFDSDSRSTVPSKRPTAAAPARKVKLKKFGTPKVKTRGMVTKWELTTKSGK